MKLIGGFLMGMAFTMLLPPTVMLVTTLTVKDEELYNKISLAMIQFQFNDPFKSLTGNCKAEQGRNGHGWEFNVREYYGCNGLEILISDFIYNQETK